ncbi:MAG: ABC-F family ATP-binding cassette domain-containing protein [Pseudomonadota bacterium]
MLTLSDITVRLGGRVIIDGASATIPDGHRVGLIGRNGAGKSTLLKVITGELDPDGGDVELGRNRRIGLIAQEAPSGDGTPLETVLAADIERADLLAAAESETDPAKIGDIHNRLADIDAYAAPSRAARILAGLGFTEAEQHQPIESFSGGWRMRVALAALLFTEPEILLLDEPSNHLDLEATLWLESFLKSYPKTLIVVSHERDLLNNVANHILHLAAGKLTLYPGGYDDFERLRGERLAQLEALRTRQEQQRKHLQSYVDRWRYKAHTARQAQSRLKALARMQPVASMAEGETIAFEFPNPSELKPPLVTYDGIAVGYQPETPVLQEVGLRLDPDDRIAMLGRNGNGKTTLARLLAHRLEPMAGDRHEATKLKVGYFAQHQVEELRSGDTPLQHMTRLMPDAKPAAVRGQLGRFGFSGDKALTEVSKLSGGERARLALALITREAPHVLILDEPTNHLDVDAREALVQAINDFTGAVILVSHDRHLVELTADRLWLIADGTAREFTGSLDDYRRQVLSGSGEAKDAAEPGGKVNRKEARRAAAKARERTSALRKQVKEAEALIEKLSRERSEIDHALFHPDQYEGDKAGQPATNLMKKRADIEKRLEKAEADWLDAQHKLEAAESDAA